MKLNKKTFSTGEFAKLLEINKDTLLYYDKIDLFKPAGTFDNGYRYYTFDQFDHFIAIQSLRAVNLPIKEIKKYFSSPNITDLKNLAIEQKKKVIQEIKKLQDIQEFLDRTVSLTKEIDQITFNEVFIETLPAKQIVYSKEKLYWSNPIEEIYAQSTSFLKKLGRTSAAAYGVVYPKDKFLLLDAYKDPESNIESYMFCHTNHDLAVLQPSGEYAIIYYKGTYEKNMHIYELLVNFLKRHNLTLTGDIHEEYLLHSISTKNENNYITKISVKVES